MIFWALLGTSQMQDVSDQEDIFFCGFLIKEEGNLKLVSHIALWKNQSVFPKHLQFLSHPE